jgi:hypothetical protein
MNRELVRSGSGEPTDVNEYLVEVSAAPQPDVDGENRLLQG